MLRFTQPKSEDDSNPGLWVFRLQSPASSSPSLVLETEAQRGHEALCSFPRQLEWREAGGEVGEREKTWLAD